MLGNCNLILYRSNNFALLCIWNNYIHRRDNNGCFLYFNDYSYMLCNPISCCCFKAFVYYFYLRPLLWLSWRKQRTGTITRQSIQGSKCVDNFRYIIDGFNISIFVWIRYSRIHCLKCVLLNHFRFSKVFYIHFILSY